MSARCLFSVCVYFGFVACLSAASLDEQEIWKRNELSVFRVRHYETKLENRRYVKSPTNYGTAFSLNIAQYDFGEKQYLLTAAHTVIKNGKVLDQLEVRVPNGKGSFEWRSIAVRAYDLTNDIALVRLDKKHDALEELELGAAVEDRAVLLTSGFPGVEELQTSVGYLITRELLAPNDNAAHWEAALDVKHGSSGGPVFDRNRKVVGMIVYAMKADGKLVEKMAYFLHLSALQEFLEKARVRLLGKNPR